MKQNLSYVESIVQKAQSEEGINLEDLELFFNQTKDNPFIHWNDYYENVIRSKFLYEYGQNINKLSRSSVESVHLSYIYLIRTLQIVESKEGFENPMEWMLALNQRIPNQLHIYQQRIILLANNRTTFALTFGKVIKGYVKSNLLGISYVDTATKEVDLHIFADAQKFEQYYESGKGHHDVSEYDEFLENFIRDEISKSYTNQDVTSIRRLPDNVFNYCLEKVRNGDFDFHGPLTTITD